MTSRFISHVEDRQSFFGHETVLAVDEIVPVVLGNSPESSEMWKTHQMKSFGLADQFQLLLGYFSPKTPVWSLEHKKLMYINLSYLTLKRRTFSFKFANSAVTVVSSIPGPSILLVTIIHTIFTEIAYQFNHLLIFI